MKRSDVREGYAEPLPFTFSSPFFLRERDEAVDLETREGFISRCIDAKGDGEQERHGWRGEEEHRVVEMKPQSEHMWGNRVPVAFSH